jgi:predicted DNA-binding transcriptional regulator YafY
MITNALYYNHYLQLRYRNSREETKNKRVMPLGLAQQGVRLYLVARFDGYDNQRILALHRIDEVEDTGDVFDYPTDFKLVDYDLAGHFGFGNGQRVHVSFCIRLDAGFYLTETPLSQDQSIIRHNDHYQVSATLIDSQLLTAWLNGWGDKVWEVKKQVVESE